MNSFEAGVIDGMEKAASSVSARLIDKMKKGIAASKATSRIVKKKGPVSTTSKMKRFANSQMRRSPVIKGLRGAFGG